MKPQIISEIGRRTVQFCATTTAPDDSGATARTFAILDLVAQAQAPVEVSSVIEALVLPKATAYRLVDGLVSWGYLAREPVRKRLTVGSRLTNLAFGVMRASMRDASRHALLQRLVHEVNETCNIGILLHGEIVYLDRVEAEHWPLRLQFGPGSRVPLHCSAIGKLFLALTPGRRRRPVCSKVSNCAASRKIRSPNGLSSRWNSSRSENSESRSIGKSISSAWSAWRCQ
jgi:DNA-binding IclR family transcriptional regulator